MADFFEFVIASQAQPPGCGPETSTILKKSVKGNLKKNSRDIKKLLLLLKDIYCDVVKMTFTECSLL